MLKSMTAYGRAAVSSSAGCFTIAIQSVNRKHLDVVLNLPKEFVCFEADLRKWISSEVARGRVVVTLSAVFEGESPVRALPNLPLARQLHSAWQAIADELGDEVGKPSLEGLMRVSDLVTFDVKLSDEKMYRSLLKKAVDDAFVPFLAMKQREGETLSQDIAQRLHSVKESIESLTGLSSGTVTKYREKLISNLEKVLGQSVQDEERILREIAIYADRIDITEEVTRAFSHIEQMEKLLSGKESIIGKPLEFLIQELNRECNTIGAKASETEVSHLMVKAKSELERIREQIQNVE